MSQCIYTGADAATESFSKAEHIFPKCIGGIHTLPKGWVCDRINHSFSALELGFARQNPTVAMTRMFLPPMGRMHTAVSSGSWCGGQRQQCGDSGSGLR